MLALQAVSAEFLGTLLFTLFACNTTHPLALALAYAAVSCEQRVTYIFYLHSYDGKLHKATCDWISLVWGFPARLGIAGRKVHHPVSHGNGER